LIDRLHWCCVNTVNGALLAVPPAVVTAIGPFSALAGTTALSVASSITAKLLAGTPSKLTALVVASPDPLIVAAALRAALAGLKLLMVGGGGGGALATATWTTTLRMVVALLAVTVAAYAPARHSHHSRIRQLKIATTHQDRAS
jgi:hypothetical protein